MPVRCFLASRQGADVVRHRGKLDDVGEIPSGSAEESWACPNGRCTSMPVRCFLASRQGADVVRHRGKLDDVGEIPSGSAEESWTLIRTGTVHHTSWVLFGPSSGSPMWFATEAN